VKLPRLHCNRTAFTGKLIKYHLDLWLDKPVPELQLYKQAWPKVAPKSARRIPKVESGVQRIDTAIIE
jgi:hypothetical protein